MKLNMEQQKKVEANLGLVGKVIKDKVHNIGQSGFYTYDDLFQIGCIGLSKAAATDKGGVFSTYAYRLIWNEICDALIYASRRTSSEELSDTVQLKKDSSSQSYSDIKVDLYSVISSAKKTATPSVAMGIDALMLMNDGYTAKEIGVRFGKTTNTITALVSKAKKHLRAFPELQLLYGASV